MARDLAGGGTNTAYGGVYDKGDRFSDIYGLYNAAVAPQYAAINNQNALLNNRIGGLSAAYGQASGAEQQKYNVGSQKIDVQLASLGPERDALHRQAGYLDQRLGITNDQTNSNIGYNRYYYDAENYLLDLMRQRAGIQNQLFGLEEKSANEDFNSKWRNSWSEAIARGGAVSTGFHEDLQDLMNLKENALGTIGANRDAYWNDLLKETQGHETNKKQLDQQRDNYLYDQQLAELDTREQQAKLRDREIQLDYQAKLLGLDKQALAANLQSGLAQLNLNRAVSVGQLMDGIASNNAQRQQLSSQVFQQALQASMY